MDHLWSPWRSQYISSFNSTPKAEAPTCFLCTALQASPEHDLQNLVVHRSETCFVIMNRYPYNAGHLMVVPNSHVGDFSSLHPTICLELMLLLQKSQTVLHTLYNAHGFNVGANLGRVAGAGLPDHIHFHIVPRWNGDTNFMPVLSDVKVVSESLEKMCSELREAFRTLG